MLGAARALQPIHERQLFGRSILLFDRADRQQLAALGDVRTPSIADLFVAVMSREAANPRSSRMSTPSTTPPSPVRMAATDAGLSWSIRRELWENRSLTVGPLAVAAFVLFVLLITSRSLCRAGCGPSRRSIRRRSTR